MSSQLLFSKPPYPVSPEGALSSFKIDVSDGDLQSLKTLLKLLPIPRPNWENGHTDRRFGTPRDWLVEAVDYWQNTYDWRKQEDVLNSIPQFNVEVEDDDGQKYTVHFAALFSENKDAVPIHFSHGWPGSFIEFVPMMLHLREKYASAPETLPYHIIVPSLIGFGFSSPPPLNKDWLISDTARVLHKAMLALGFGERGYVTQGGDLGGPIAETLAAVYEPVKATHLNVYFKGLSPAAGDGLGDILKSEHLQNVQKFWATGMAYANLQGTRPSTAGLAIGNSPVSLLAWIGEKMIEWADPATTPSLDTILNNVSIYWFSGSYPTSIWCYRAMLAADGSTGIAQLTNGKPRAQSWFPKEIVAPPKDLIKADPTVTHFYAHEKGGHFAALECPEDLWADVEDFVSKVWKD
ncbi:Alpha/beta hydrolase fold-1 [Macrophomina phaseolina MS6]|uniref:Alpha/beta hydrolase fold-1 n=1 Tax=Macrophomina phaseolina (strain MS6) TaxID=1126212 RepID=K2RJM8_MACPH|nr:Alpha/beta hydrolase fold-1 [Macrophomina phaseolina MS6]